MDGGPGKGQGPNEAALKAVHAELQHAGERLKEHFVKRDFAALRSYCSATLHSLELAFSRHGLVELDFEAKHKGMVLREENLALKEEVFGLKKKMWEDERDRCQATLKLVKKDFSGNTEMALKDDPKLKSLLEEVSQSLKKKASYIEGYFEKIDSDLRELKTKDFSSSMFLLVLEKIRIYKARSNEKFHKLICKLNGSKIKKGYQECLSEQESDEETPLKLLPVKKNVFDRQDLRESKFESVGDHLKRRLIEKRVVWSYRETISAKQGAAFQISEFHRKQKPELFRSQIDRQQPRV